MVYQHNNVVVCGIDGSAASLNALKWAAGEAATREAQLEIICCYEEATYAKHQGNEHDRAIFLGEAEKHLKDAAELVASSSVEVTTEAIFADPTTALIAKSKKVARVVIGARGGSGGFADRLLGSVASAVSARAYCAVVVVPSTPVEEIMPAKHVVCGFDGSEASRLALELAIRETSRWGGHLSAVSTVNFAGSTWLPGAEYHADVLEGVRSGLREAVSRAAIGYDLDIRCHAIEGNAAGLLAEFSTAVDLIVVGTRGRGGFTGLLLGSTSQAMIQHSKCPVIVVPRRTRDNEDATPVTPWVRSQDQR